MKKRLIMSLVCVGALLGAGWLLTSHFAAYADEGGTESPLEPQSASGVDVETYTRVQALRKQLRLGNEDLAAIGCSQQTAEQVLTALAGWYGTNKAQLDAARTAEASALRDLRSAMSRIRSGDRDETLLAQLPALRSEVPTTAKSYRDLIQTAIPVIEAKLSAAQKAAWQTSRTEGGGTGDLRYVGGLTAAQRRSLHLARRSRARRLAAARTAQQRASIESAYTNAVDQTLSAAQKQSLATIRQNIRQNMAGVLAGESAVLPRPAELDVPDVTEVD